MLDLHPNVYKDGEIIDIIDYVVYNIYGEMDSTAREAALQRRRETTAKVQKKERPDLRVRYGQFIKLLYTVYPPTEISRDFICKIT